VKLQYHFKKKKKESETSVDFGAQLATQQQHLVGVSHSEGKILSHRSRQLSWSHGPSKQVLTNLMNSCPDAIPVIKDQKKKNSKQKKKVF
jgi:sulfate adenylyltransferase subunit 1 (EFTu-like GTPase family)